MEWFYNLHGWQQALLATAFTWALTAAGAALVFIFKKINEKTFAFLMSSAAGIMLASTFFSLLLPAVESGGEYSYIIVSVGFVLGGLLIIGCDVLLKNNEKNQGNCKSNTAVMYVAVTAHNVPEGLAIGVAFGALSAGNVSAVSAVMLAVGIAVQNFPEGMCVAFPLRASGLSRFKSFFLGQLSGAVEILGGVLGALAVNFFTSLLPWALSFSAGAMLAVVCSELIPESFKNGKITATAGVLFGFVLMMVLDIALG